MLLHFIPNRVDSEKLLLLKILEFLRLLIFLDGKGRSKLVPLKDNFEMFHELCAQIPRCLVTFYGFENSHIARVFIILFDTQSFCIHEQITIVYLECFLVKRYFEGFVNIVHILALSLEFTKISLSIARDVMDAILLGKQQIVSIRNENIWKCWVDYHVPRNLLFFDSFLFTGSMPIHIWAWIRIVKVQNFTILLSQISHLHFILYRHFKYFIGIIEFNPRVIFNADVSRNGRVELEGWVCWRIYRMNGKQVFLLVMLF